MASTSQLRVSPLGGVGEVGKNSTLIEFGDDMVIVDAGVKFPEAELHGIDLVVCDYSYVVERLDSLLGILFTHGHEDHIGGVPYLIMQLDPHDPLHIYGTPLTLGLISVKLKEHGMLGRVIQHPIREGEHAHARPLRRRAGGRQPQHSRRGRPGDPHAGRHGLPYGRLQVRSNPGRGKTTDNERLQQLGDEGVLVLLSDCVRVEQAGWTPSESGVRDALEQLIGAAQGRVVVTTFASNIGRLREVVISAHKLGRKTAIVGRSMEQNLKVAG